MTNTVEQARRKAFEAEYLKLDQQAPAHLAFIRDDGQYGYHGTRTAWACYNAALDSLFVTLPIETYGCMAASEVVEAIHAAGVKTR